MAEKRSSTHLSAHSHKGQKTDSGETSFPRSGGNTPSDSSNRSVSAKTGRSPASTQGSQDLFTAALREGASAGSSPALNENEDPWLTSEGDFANAQTKKERSESPGFFFRAKQNPQVTSTSPLIKVEQDTSIDPRVLSSTREQDSSLSPAVFDYDQFRFENDLKSESPTNSDKGETTDWAHFGAENSPTGQQSASKHDDEDDTMRHYFEFGDGKEPEKPLPDLPPLYRAHSPETTAITASTSVSHKSYDKTDVTLSELDKIQSGEFSADVLKSLRGRNAKFLTVCLTHNINVPQAQCPHTSKAGRTSSCIATRANRATAHWLDALNRHAQNMPASSYPLNSQDAQTINFTEEVRTKFTPDYPNHNIDITDDSRNEPAKKFMEKLKELREKQREAAPSHPVFYEQQATGIPTDERASGMTTSLPSEHVQEQWALRESMKQHTQFGDNAGEGSSRG
ncbi:hypothetical protein IAT40_004741 [Kwoniella sp. CBS 6097]